MMQLENPSLRKALAGVAMRMHGHAGGPKKIEEPPALRQVLGYARFSGAGQHESSIEKQEEQITNYCISNDLRSPLMFYDRARTGRTDDRSGYQQMLAHVGPGTIVLVAEMTRFAREALLMLQMVREVKKAGGVLMFVNTGHADQIYITFLAGIAEYDFQSVCTRLRDGRLRSLADGNTGRKAPYGYRNTEAGMEIYPDEARWVKLIHTRRLAGESYKDITIFLNEEKVPTKSGKGHWRAQGVRRICLNPIYAGFVVTKRPRFEWEEEDGQ